MNAHEVYIKSMLFAFIYAVPYCAHYYLLRIGPRGKHGADADFAQCVEARVPLDAGAQLGAL